MKKGIKETVREAILPVAEELGYRIWDVTYQKVGADYHLEITIDADGGIDIEDCERISRILDPLLDEADPIPDSYVFEVGSAGLERELKRPGDFEQFMGSPVLVKLYRPRNGLKEIPGILRGYEDGKVTVEAGKETITFEKSQVALVRLRVEF